MQKERIGHDLTDQTSHLQACWEHRAEKQQQGIKQYSVRRQRMSRQSRRPMLKCL